MGDKVYLVNYYMDYETHGLQAIFKHRKDAEEYAKILEKKDEDIDCHYDVYEEIIYNSLDESWNPSIDISPFLD